MSVENGDWEAADVLVHDEANKAVAQMLVDMRFPDFPIALGVIFCAPAPSFEASVIEQNRTVSEGKSIDLAALIRKGQTWEVNQKQPREI